MRFSSAESKSTLGSYHRSQLSHLLRLQLKHSAKNHPGEADVRSRGFLSDFWVGLGRNFGLFLSCCAQLLEVWYQSPITGWSGGFGMIARCVPVGRRVESSPSQGQSFLPTASSQQNYFTTLIFLPNSLFHLQQKNSNRVGSLGRRFFSVWTSTL